MCKVQMLLFPRTPFNCEKSLKPFLSASLLLLKVLQNKTFKVVETIAPLAVIKGKVIFKIK